MEIFRRLKHWHLFLLIIGIPIAIQFIQSILILSSREESPSGLASILGLLLIIPLVIYFLWIGAVGKKFSKSEKSPPMRTRRFNLSLWLSFLSHFFLLIYFWSYPRNVDPSDGEEVLPISMVALIVFIALFTLFYCLSFMAKAIVQYERGAKVHSSEFFSEFVMAVIFPIGIWLLQPRINRLEHHKVA